MKKLLRIFWWIIVFIIALPLIILITGSSSIIWMVMTVSDTVINYWIDFKEETKS